MPNALSDLVAQLASGALRVVDLTQPLSSQTPLLPLPPHGPTRPPSASGRSPATTSGALPGIGTASKPANTRALISTRPSTGFSGKDLPDNSVDRISPQKFIGPACVIDVTGDAGRNPDFLLTVDRVEQWESAHGRIPAGAWLLLRTEWSKRSDPRLHQSPRGRAAHSGIREGVLGAAGARPRRPGRRRGDGGHRCRPAPPPSIRRFRNHYVMHGSGKFGLAGPLQSGPIASDRRRHHRRPSENC